MLNTKIPTASLAIAAALSLSGCVSFGSKPPSQLLTLDSAQKVAVGPAPSTNAAKGIIVAEPEAPKTLDTVRVPVQVSPTSVAYVTDVQWSDTPRHLFRSLLAETIAANANHLVLDPGQYSGAPTQRLQGELVNFGIDSATNSAIVTYDAILSAPGGVIVARQRFTANSPVNGKIAAATVGGPLNAAANKVAGDVSLWLTSLGR